MRRRWRSNATDASRNIARDRGSAFGAAVSVAAALTAAGAALLVHVQADRAEAHWRDRAQLTVYLCTADSVAPTCADAPSDAAVADIGGRLAAAPGVTATTFETAKDAYDEFVARHAGTDIARSVSVDALPASFRVAVDDAHRAELLADVATWDGVETTVDQRELLGGFFTIAGRVAAAAALAALLQGAGTVAVLASMIRSSIRARRRELAIMGLVGAAPRRLRGPFVVETVTVTVTGTAIAAAGLAAAVTTARPLLAATGAPIGAADAVAAAAFLGAVTVAASWALTRVLVARHTR